MNQKLVIKLDISVFSMLIQHQNPPRTWIVAFLDFTPLIPNPDGHCLWGHWFNLLWRELRRCVLSMKTRQDLFGCAAAAAAAAHQALLGVTRRLPSPKESHLKRFPVLNHRKVHISDQLDDLTQKKKKSGQLGSWLTSWPALWRSPPACALWFRVCRGWQTPAGRSSWRRGGTWCSGGRSSLENREQWRTHYFSLCCVSLRHTHDANHGSQCKLALRALNQGTQLPAGSKKIYSTRVYLFCPELVEPVLWEIPAFSRSLGFTGTCTACSLFLPCHLRLSNDNILLGLLGELSRESLFSLLHFCLNVCFKKKPTYYWKSALHDVTEGTGTSPRLAKTEPANRVTAKYAVFWHTIRSNP